MWLWWPKDISNVLWGKVTTVIQAAEKLVHSRVSLLLPALPLRIVAYFPLLGLCLLGFGRELWMKCIIPILRPPEGLLVSLGEVTYAVVAGLKIAHVGTSVLQPNSHRAGSRSVSGSQVAQTGVLMLPLTVTCPGESSSGQSLQMTWVGFRLSLNQEPCRLSAGTLLFILTFLKSQDNRSFWNGAYMHNIFLVNRSQKLHWACTNLQNAENLYWRVFEKFQIKSL